MPNRIIKESICTSDNLNGLSPQEEVMFYRLLVNCDDYGRFDARPVIILARCFPLKVGIYDELTILRWLKSLVEHGLVSIYSTDGKHYVQITTWNKHQQIRAHRSKYPDPTDSLSSDIIFQQLISDDIHMSTEPSQPKSDPNTALHNYVGNQLISDDSSCTRNPIQSNPIRNPIQYTRAFDKFWEAYPKKLAKAAALKAFKKINPTDQLVEKILAAIEKAKRTESWQKDSGQFIPYPATYLNGLRWEDEIVETQGNGHKQPNQLSQTRVIRDTTGEGIAAKQAKNPTTQS